MCRAALRALLSMIYDVSNSPLCHSGWHSLQQNMCCSISDSVICCGRPTTHTGIPTGRPTTKPVDRGFKPHFFYSSGHGEPEPVPPPELTELRTDFGPSLKVFHQGIPEYRPIKPIPLSSAPKVTLPSLPSLPRRNAAMSKSAFMKKQEYTITQKSWNPLIPNPFWAVPPRCTQHTHTTRTAEGLSAGNHTCAKHI